jgi:hypothetical protein
MKWLSSIIGDRLKVFDLDELSRNSIESITTQIKDHTRIVIMSREIDTAGTFLPDVSIEIFQRMLMILSECISKLHLAGIQRIIVVTDHGFLLLPRGQKYESVPICKKEDDFDVSRRYVIGKPPKEVGFLSLPLESVGLGGEEYVMFPYGITTVGIRGESGQFVHGGISLQENCIAALISTMNEKIEKVGVEVVLPSQITTAVFLVELKPFAKGRKDLGRRVYVQVFASNELISKSDTVLLEREPKKVRLILKKFPDNVQIRVIDADSKDAITNPGKVKVHLSGYGDDLL